VVNRKTFFNNIMGLKGSDGHPIWKQVMSSNENKPVFVLNGYPVVFSNALPAFDDAAAGETYMVVGNFKAMKLNFPEGMNTRITRDEITEMHLNTVRYLSEIYVAGNIVKPGCFVKVTK
jgi:HK97 family phage major capsid protein